MSGAEHPAVAVLRAIGEWGGQRPVSASDPGMGLEPCCWICKRSEAEGHAAGCLLVAAMRPAAEHPAVALLREIEWGDHDAQGGRMCPDCGADGAWFDVEGRRHEGQHEAGCRLAAILAGSKPAAFAGGRIGWAFPSGHRCTEERRTERGAKEQALCMAHATASTALADLLRAALERGKEIGAADEREACAQVVERYSGAPATRALTLLNVAAAIRARGQQ